MSGHREALSALLRTGASACVDLDPRAAGVIVPEALRARDALTLEYGERLAVPIPDLEIGDEGIAATLSFQRVPSRTFVPWSAVRAVRPGSVRAVCCALCGRARQQVELLIEGSLGSVCGECVGYALAACESDRSYGALGTFSFRALDAVLAELPPTLPRGESEPLIAGAFALTRGEPARIEALTRRAVALAQPEWALRISEAIPPPGRGFELRKLRMFAHLSRLDARAALAEIDGIDPAALDPRARVELLANRAAAAGELEPVDASTLIAALRAAEAAIDALGPASDPRFAMGARRSLGPAWARACLVSGDLDGARQRLGELLAATHAQTLRVAADVTAALSGLDAARPIYARARGYAHPESALAALLDAKSRAP